MFHLLLSFFLSYYAGKAVLKCSGGTDCSRSGVAVPAQPGNVDCGLNRSATEGGDVVLDSSVLFASGGHERQVVEAVYIDGPSGGLQITCTINGTVGSCVGGDVGIRIVEDSIEEGGALNISLTLQDVTLEHSGGYTVKVVASTLTKMSEQCLRYHLTVDGTFENMMFAGMHALQWLQNALPSASHTAVCRVSYCVVCSIHTLCSLQPDHNINYMPLFRGA